MRDHLAAVTEGEIILLDAGHAAVGISASPGSYQVRLFGGHALPDAWFTAHGFDTIQYGRACRTPDEAAEGAVALLERIGPRRYRVSAAATGKRPLSPFLNHQRGVVSEFPAVEVRGIEAALEIRQQ